MHRFWKSSLLAVVALLAVAAPASGQMFGNRNLGAESIGRRTRPGAATDNASGLLGNPNLDPGVLMSQGLMNPGARFIRGNRDAADFVGRDFMETRNFVGSESGGLTMSALRSAVNELRPPVDSDANQQPSASAARKNTMYPPRLRVDFPISTPQSRDQAESAVDRLAERLGSSAIQPVGISLVGRTAILQGEVASEHQRNLAAALASLEPGIDAVLNDLVVSEERDSGPPSPAGGAFPTEELLPPPLEPRPSTSESRAPRSSPTVRQPVVRPVGP